MRELRRGLLSNALIQKEESGYEQSRLVILVLVADGLGYYRVELAIVV